MHIQNNSGMTFDQHKYMEPDYFAELQRNLPPDVDGRITEIKKEIAEIEALRKANRISAHDIENVSDLYEFHLEWNCLLSELREELQYLEQVQLLTVT